MATADFGGLGVLLGSPGRQGITVGTTISWPKSKAGKSLRNEFNVFGHLPQIFSGNLKAK